MQAKVSNFSIVYKKFIYFTENKSQNCLTLEIDKDGVLYYNSMEHTIRPKGPSMKPRFIASGILLALCLSLCACTASRKNTHLKGKKTEYTDTIACADEAWGGVQIVESDGTYTLKNQRAQLEFDKNTDDFSLSSLQTGETILQSTVSTYLTAADGKIGQISGGNEGVYQGNYGVSHSRTDSSVRFPASPSDATVLKEFDLTENDAKTAFAALKHEASQNEDGTGLKITSKGALRSQFGARSLNLPLGTADRYYLSVTLKAKDISGLKCYFSTSDVPLTEDTSLGTLPLTEANGQEFITLTAEIKNDLWTGTLQTLLFRLPEGEAGSVEISRIAILQGNDPLTEQAADTHWTVYADRIYFAQSLKIDPADYTSATTVISLPKAKCREIISTDDAVALKLIDGSVFGVVRPVAGALSTEEADGEIRLILRWDLSQANPSLALRIYLNYTEDLADFHQIAEEERNPLTAEDFTPEGAELEGYDAKNGLYRLKPTGESVTLSVKKNDRTLYFYLPPTEDTGWSLLDQKGNRLPIFAGTVFPIRATEKPLTVRLVPETKTEAVEPPSFFADSGLLEQSRSYAVLNGLYAQSTTVYEAPDGDYSLSLTATRLQDGITTVYDVEYTFHTRTQVADLRRAFPLFSLDADFEFDEYFYLNGEDQTVTVPVGAEEFSYLGAMPYVGMNSDGKSVGWLISNGRMTADGIPSTALTCLRYEAPGKLYLSFDQDEITFGKGDTLTAQIIRRDGGSADEDTLKALRDGGNFRLIQTETNETKSFTVAGMEEKTVVQIEGFDRYTFPKITANGEAFTPEYRVYVDQNGYYGFAFSVADGTKLELKK